MKRILFYVLTVAMFAACSKQEQLNFYGEKIEASDAMTSSDFLAEMSNADSAELKVEAKIIETCSKKGCWMTVDLGDGNEMRVTFKDYGFFVPTDNVEGKPVVFQGIAKKSVTDVATLQHFAEDAGKSEEEIAAITQPQEELTFVATGVAINQSQE